MSQPSLMWAIGGPRHGSPSTQTPGHQSARGSGSGAAAGVCPHATVAAAVGQGVLPVAQALLHRTDRGRLRARGIFAAVHPHVRGDGALGSTLDTTPKLHEGRVHLADLYRSQSRPQRVAELLQRCGTRNRSRGHQDQINLVRSVPAWR